MDFKLDQTTGELAFSNGGLVLTSGQDRVRQMLDIKFHIFQGEYFLDPTIGIDYYGRILGNHPFIEVDSEIVRGILTTKGVLDLVEPVEYNRNRATRTLETEFKVTTDLGELEVDLELPFTE